MTRSRLPGDRGGRGDAEVAGPKGKVLVTDDNPTNVDLLARRLVRKGYEVDTALSGQEALAAVAAATYDAVLLDIMMPVMSGLEVLRRIRADFGKHELPVIMATAKTDSRDVVEALRLGANDYVTKPLDFPIVLARLESQIAVRREFLSVKPETVVVSGTDELGPGVVLDGRYEIESPLGEGGFAVVYRAKQLSTGQAVALKILRSQRMVTSEEGGANELARFRQEMKVIATVRHPAIVRLVDSGAIELRGAGDASYMSPRQTDATEVEGRGPSEDDSAAGSHVETDLLAHTMVSLPDAAPAAAARLKRERMVPYYVMELLEGETLGDLIEREGGLGVEYSLELLMPVLCGVHTMHAHGILHRDLKPTNIFLARDPAGSVHSRVLDFGIAKLRKEGAPDLTTDVGFIGTPAYMSPEQAIGARDLGPGSDQYTLAAVLYEAITGRRPYRASGYMHLLTLVSNAEYVPIDEVAQVEPALRDVVHRALARRPEDRFEHLMAFGQALLAASTPTLQARWMPTLLNHCRPASELAGEPAPTPRASDATPNPEAPTQPGDGSVEGRDPERGPGGYTLIDE